MSIEFLRRLPLFASLPEADLEELYRRAEPMTLSPGELLIEEGAPGDALFVLLDGELQVSKRSGAQDVKVDVRLPGAVIGEMSLLDNLPRSASVRGLTQCHLLKVSQDAFERTLSTSPAAALATLHTVVARLRQNDALLHEKEKMAGLGTLAAGLAHELNNPAAAVRRATSQLRELLGKWQQAMSALDRLELDDHQREHVDALRQDMARRAANPIDLDPVARSDREGEVESWLEAHGVAEAWELAPTLVSFGWQVADLEHLAEHFDAQGLSVIAQSLGIGSAVFALLAEVATGSERISEIVQGRQVLLLSGPRAGAGSGCARGPGQHAGHPAPQAQQDRHHHHARLRSEPAAHRGLCRRAEPGVDEYSRQRRGCPGPEGQYQSCTRSGKTITWWSSWPTMVPGFRARSSRGCSSPSSRPSRRAWAPAWG